MPRFVNVERLELSDPKRQTSSQTDAGNHSLAGAASLTHWHNRLKLLVDSISQFGSYRKVPAEAEWEMKLAEQALIGELVKIQA